MTITDGTHSATARLKAQGRVVLPSAVRQAAHLEEGATLIVHVLAEGRLILETPEAARARVQAAAPSRTGLDTVTEIRTMRDEDIQIADSAAERRSGAAMAASPEESAAVGARLLAHLGLA